MFLQGEEVFVKHLGLWQVGRIIQRNKDGTWRVRVGRSKLDIKHWDVQRKKEEKE